MLADLQEALARLLVDARARTPSGLDALGRELALAPAELAALRAIDPAQLERLATSLQTKRRRAVEATVPQSLRIWPALGPRYLDILAASPARSEDLDADLGPGPSELLRVLPGLRAAAREDDLAPPWTGDLIALELARACVRRDHRPRALHARYPVHRALAALDAGWLGAELEVWPCEYRVEVERLRFRAWDGST